MPSCTQLLLIAFIAGSAQAAAPSLRVVPQEETGAPDETQADTSAEAPSEAGEGQEGDPSQGSEELPADSDESSPPRPAFPQLAVVQIGTDFLAHRINYSDPGVEGLLDYRASMVLTPALHAELYPLSRFQSGALSELGLQVDYSLSVGAKVRAGTEGRLHSTRASRWGLGAKFRVKADPGVALSVEPSLGFRSMSFSVRTARDGAALEALPNLRYHALQAGVAAEIPRALGLAFFLSAAYLHALPGATLGDKGALSVDSEGGVEVMAGVGFWLGPRSQLRLAGHYTRAVFAFEPEPGQELLAGGASDKRSGMTAALRWSY
jgi:hypothetical protein